ncbi:MAG: PRC-barrel domain-containing protein, partial [Oscillospiraceae bacterium]
HVDLIGITVVDNNDNSIVYGTITDVSQTGANDVYHLKMNGNTKDNDNREVLIPAIKDVIIKTDINDGKMFINPMRGLFEDFE